MLITTIIWKCFRCKCWFSEEPLYFGVLLGASLFTTTTIVICQVIDCFLVWHSIWTLPAPEWYIFRAWVKATTMASSVASQKHFAVIGTFSMYLNCIEWKWKCHESGDWARCIAQRWRRKNCEECPEICTKCHRELLSELVISKFHCVKVVISTMGVVRFPDL